MRASCMRGTHTWVRYDTFNNNYRKCSRLDCQKTQQYVNNTWVDIDKNDS